MPGRVEYTAHKTARATLKQYEREAVKCGCQHFYFSRQTDPLNLDGYKSRGLFETRGSYSIPAESVRVHINPASMGLPEGRPPFPISAWQQFHIQFFSSLLIEMVGCYSSYCVLILRNSFCYWSICLTHEEKIDGIFDILCQN